MRDAFGWKPGTKLAFVREKDGVRIVALAAEDPGAALVRRSRGIAATSMSTDEIMRLTRGDD